MGGIQETAPCKAGTMVQRKLPLFRSGHRQRSHIASPQQQQKNISIHPDLDWDTHMRALHYPKHLHHHPLLAPNSSPSLSSSGTYRRAEETAVSAFPAPRRGEKRLGAAMVLLTFSRGAQAGGAALPLPPPPLPPSPSSRSLSPIEGRAPSASQAGGRAAAALSPALSLHSSPLT